jgi:DNA polymerase III epsilon subunit-like protein
VTDSDMWVIIDTETTGLRNPVYPVEIAAQRMQGWNPSGDPWRALLDFNVPIDPIAERIHGYSREYLHEHGIKPIEAFRSLADYAGSEPIVAYNLPFDWNRVLAPTIQHLHVRCSLHEGFCALSLTRNVVPAMPDFKLKTVIKTFELAEKQQHHAGDDVAALALFLSRYLGPHLTRSSVVGYTKVARCAQGVLSAPPLPIPEKERRSRKRKPDKEDLFAVGELVGICRAIMLDEHVTDEEANFLARWLEDCPHSSDPPFNRIFETIRGIVADGKVTEDERSLLAASIEQVVQWKTRPGEIESPSDT